MKATYDMEQLTVVDVVKGKVLFTSHYTQDNARARVYRVPLKDVLRPHGRYEFVSYEGELDWLMPMSVAWRTDCPAPIESDRADVHPIVRVMYMTHHRVVVDPLFPSQDLRETVTYSWPELRKRLRPCTQENVNAMELRHREDANRRAQEGMTGRPFSTLEEAIAEAPPPPPQFMAATAATYTPQPLRGFARLRGPLAPEPVPIEEAKGDPALTRLVRDEAEQLAFPFPEPLTVLNREEVSALRGLLFAADVTRLPILDVQGVKDLLARFTSVVTGPSEEVPGIRP